MKYISILSFSIKNLKKRPFRTFVIILSVVIASGTLFAGSLIMRSVENSVTVGTKRLGADIMVVPKGYESQARATLIGSEPSAFYMSKDVIERIKSIEGVKNVSPQIFVVSAPYVCCDVSETRIIGFDPLTDLTITPWLTGRKIKEIKPDEVILGRELPFYAGQHIQLYGRSFLIRATLDATGMSFFDNSVFMPLEGVYGLIRESKNRKDVKPINITDDQISAVLVQLAPEAYPQRIGLLIEAQIEDVKAIVAEDVITSVRRQLSVILKAIFTLSAIIWVMVILMISAGFSMIVNERKREIGLLRAMGANKGYMFREIMYEAALQTLGGGVIGILTGGIIIVTFKNLMTKSMKLPYLWPSPEFIALLTIICIGLSLLSGIISALYPAIRSANLDPYDAIREGE